MAELLLLLTSKIIDCVEQAVLDLYACVRFKKEGAHNCDIAAGMVQTLAEEAGKQKLSGCKRQRHFCFAETPRLPFGRVRGPSIVGPAAW